ncbi:MAG: pyridoxal phosphate-dependent aminotransferase [Thermoplasmata archaeon]
MVRVSSRMEGLAESGTVRMANMERELKARGIKTISFALGEPDFPTPAHIVEAAAEAMRAGFTHYTASKGIPELREAIAEKSRVENGIPCSPDDVLVTPTKLGIYLAMMAFVDRDDEVVVPDPGWVSYIPMVRLAGGKPVPLRLRAEDDFRMTPERLAEALTPRTRAVVLNSPSNPTGSVATEADMKGIADLARDHDLLVLTDEIYEKLIYEGRHVSIASLDGMFERTITFNGLSKSYAMTGWRLGWVVAPKELMKQLDRLQQHTLTCAPSFAQKGAVAALRGPQDCVDRMREEFRRRRDFLLGRLEASGLFECRRPSGAFYLFPKYRVNMPSLELAEKLLEKAHVALTPGSAFGPGGEGHIRISYATSMENLEEGMRRIEEAMGGSKGAR